MTIPGVGPLCAMVVNAFVPPMESFGCGRDFAAWIGRTPRQNSTAGRQRLERITKMGQRDLRRLLVLGATAVLRHMRMREELDDPWFRKMIAEKPPKLVQHWFFRSRLSDLLPSRCLFLPAITQGLPATQGMLPSTAVTAGVSGTRRARLGIPQPQLPRRAVHIVLA